MIDFLVAALFIIIGFSFLSEANKARNWPTQLAWALLALFFFAAAVARA